MSAIGTSGRRAQVCLMWNWMPGHFGVVKVAERFRLRITTPQPARFTFRQIRSSVDVAQLLPTPAGSGRHVRLYLSDMSQDDRQPGLSWAQIHLMLLFLLGFILIVVAAVFGWEAIHYYFVPSMGGKADQVKDLLTVYEQHASELQALISALLLVTVFYSVAIASFTYLNARAALEDARRSAGEAERIKIEIHKTFPLFADFEIHVEQFLSRVDGLFPDVDWSRGFYDKLLPETKLEVLFYERSLAAIDILNMQPFRKQASQAYRGVGCFYGTKYYSDRRKHMENEEDYHWARFYLDKAILTHTNIRALNDRAAFAMILGKEDSVTAKSLFQRSAEIDPEHQRALYNLALLFHREGKGKTGTEAISAFERSIALATTALELRRWQEKEETPFQSSIRYNRACAHSRLAQIDSSRRGALLDKAVADLTDHQTKAMFSNQHEDLGNSLRNDAKPDGDLHLLTTMLPYRAIIEELLSQI